MKIKIALNIVQIAIPLCLFCAGARVEAPSPADWADTESVTNVVFAAGDVNSRLFNLSLELDATVSNNVTLAFPIRTAS